MASDMYKKRNLEQVNNDVKNMEDFDPYNLGLSRMPSGLDSDLKKQLLQDKKKIEMEEIRLKSSSDYEEMIRQLDTNGLSMDSASEINHSSNNTSQSNFQSENVFDNIPRKYSQEEVANALSAIERHRQQGQELLASLGLSENEETEEHSIKHR